MRALALVLAAQLAASGCATSFLIVQAAGSPSAFDEDNREVRVPQPGLTEHLIVRMPIAVEYDTTQGVNGGPPVRGAARPFAFSCSRTQAGQDLIVRHAYRYGGGFRKRAIIAVLLEAAIGAAGLLSATNENPGGYAWGGFFALDAIATVPLIFIPRTEISAENRVAVNAQLDDSCPDGLTVALAGRTYEINAAGRVTVEAERELTSWRSAATMPLEVTYSGQRRDLVLTGYGDPTVEIPVPVGTLTH